jgi:hypothetical protein
MHLLLRASSSLHSMNLGRDHEVFSKVTGERPSSFQGIMDGGPPGPHYALRSKLVPIHDES